MVEGRAGELGAARPTDRVAGVQADLAVGRLHVERFGVDLEDRSRGEGLAERRVFAPQEFDRPWRDVVDGRFHRKRRAVDAICTPDSEWCRVEIEDELQRVRRRGYHSPGTETRLAVESPGVAIL